MQSDYETLNTILQDRHSCRGFLPTPVADDVIEQIVRAAGRVPSWCNAQPWQVVISRPDQTDAFRKVLLDAAQTQTEAPDMNWPTRYSGAYQMRRRICGWQLYQAVGVPKGDREASRAEMLKNFSLFGAPHVAIITTEYELGPYGAMDTGGFVAAFTLAAQALGVATIPQAAVAAYAPTVREFFEIPENRQILCAISLGFEDKAHPANQFRTERAGLDEILSWKG